MPPKLPTEIVRMIFEDNADDQITLRLLSTLSREFRSLAQEVLYREVKIPVRTSQRSSELLVRLFTSPLSTPPVQECVRHLTLSFPTISNTRIDPWCITVLRHLNRLTHVTIDVHHIPEPARAPTENGNIRHGSVNGTTYLDPQPEFVQLVQALTTLPNTPIDHIDVHILLEERDHNGADLSRFFSVPLQPSRLTLSMPDFCDPWATRIAPRIAHVAQRLTHLHVKEIWPGWRRKQRSRADFSGLSSLVELRVPAAMWFDHAALGVSVPPGQNVSWQGFIWLEGDIYRPSILSLVPTSLQTLHVDFPAHNGAIFALGKGYIQHLEKKLTSPGQTLNNASKLVTA